MKLTPKFNSTDEIWLRFRQAKLQNSHCQRHIYVCVCCFRFAFSLQVCAATQNYSFNVVAKSFRNTAIFCHTVRGSRISEQVHGMFVFCMFDSFFFLVFQCPSHVLFSLFRLPLYTMYKCVKQMQGQMFFSPFHVNYGTLLLFYT